MRSSEVAGGTAWGLPMLLRDEAEAGDAALLQRLRDGLDGGACWVGVETDGTHLARDHAFGLALRRLSARVHLRVAGSSERVHVAVHGRDLRRLQRKALDACTDLGLMVVLVMAVEPGLNDRELGDVTLLGLEHPAVRAAVFHPSAGPGFQPGLQADLPVGGQMGLQAVLYPTWAPIGADELVRRLVLQLPGMLGADHFARSRGRRVACLLSDGDDVVPLDPSPSREQEADWLTATSLSPTAAAAPGTAGTAAGASAARAFTIVIEEAAP